ncbi:MAG: FKBP-type peptidyl-prolyl cis-trans isomerase [Myxococcaceae bacterium]
MPSGLTYQILKPGTGDEAKAGEKISVQYVGTLLNGTEFDRSSDPFVFRLGAGQVIKGWDEGLAGMREGERRKLTIPPELGYGSDGSGPIPPNSTLTFDVELVEVR